LAGVLAGAGPGMARGPSLVREADRRGRCSRLAVSKDNGRLDHGEALEMTRICRKTPVIPELRHISTATRHIRSHRDIQSCHAALLTPNDLETTVRGTQRVHVP
jgi:hypothetical protein